MKKIFIDTKFRTIEVPVMRNGKPTKKMKSVIESYTIENEYESIEIEGHLCFYNPQELEKWCSASLRKENGDFLEASYKYGYSGQVIHKHVVEINKNFKLVHRANGLGGSTRKGWGASLVKINW